MAEHAKSNDGIVPAEDAVAPPELVYEPNDKHRYPWQRGAKGSLCDKAVRPLAQQLLRESALVKQMRYAVHDGKAYCGKEHLPGRWHGHPVGWKEVPAKLRTLWVKQHRVSKRQIDTYWRSHS